MAGKKPWEQNVVVLYETSTYTVVTPAGAYVYDKKTGKLIKFVPEMDPNMAPLIKNLEVLAAVTSLLQTTKGLHEAEELNVQAARTLQSSAKAVEVAVKDIAKPAKL